jgi:hypothetical protein
VKWRSLTAVAVTVTALAIADAGVVGSGADQKALSQAAMYQPQAHWSVARTSLEPWASNVVRGQARCSGGFGPAWVVELTAPGDSRWKNYEAMVVINALTGSVVNVDVLASN